MITEQSEIRDTVCSPVFIVGAMRSGSTLLRLMMDHHPQISNFGEFDYPVKWITNGQFPSIKTYRKNLEYDRIFLDHNFNIDPDLDYANLSRSFIEQASHRCNTPIIAATVHANLSYLSDIWQTARFIHLVRDPRDVSHSCVKMNWAGNVWYGVNYWINPICQWKTLLKQTSAELRMEVRYEELVSNPKQQLIRICDFLNLKYYEEMLSYPKYTTYKAPHQALANKWKHSLSKREIQLIEFRCKNLMQEFGYEISDPNPLPPTFFNRVTLYLEHRTNRLVENIRRYGLVRWMVLQFTKILPHGSLKKKVLTWQFKIIDKELL